VLRAKTTLLDDPRVRGPQTTRFSSSPRLKRSLVALRTALFKMGYHNSLRWLIREYSKHPPFHEDLFWSFHARKLLPTFKIPTPQEAVAFAFEMAPRYCFRQNSNQLPFGCHAWARYDRDFWIPYLLT
jgi:hypothetical protein